MRNTTKIKRKSLKIAKPKGQVRTGIRRKGGGKRGKQII